MKNIYKLGIIVVFSAILFGCSSRTYTIDDNAKTKELTLNSVFTVSLEGNPTTGYIWSDITERNTCLTQLNKGKEYATDSSANKNVGKGGTYTFKYKIQSAGETDLKLIYSRPWVEITPPINTFTMKIIAGKTETANDK